MTIFVVIVIFPSKPNVIMIYQKMARAYGSMVLYSSPTEKRKIGNKRSNYHTPMAGDATTPLLLDWPPPPPPLLPLSVVMPLS